MKKNQKKAKTQARKPAKGMQSAPSVGCFTRFVFNSFRLVWDIKPGSKEKGKRGNLREGREAPPRAGCFTRFTFNSFRLAWVIKPGSKGVLITQSQGYIAAQTAYKS